MVRNRMPEMNGVIRSINLSWSRVHLPQAPLRRPNDMPIYTRRQTSLLAGLSDWFRMILLSC